MVMKLIRGLLIVTALSFSTGLYGNNLQLSNVTTTGKNTSSDYVLVQFDVSWENSWRVNSGPSNWDAVWIFIKYRVTTNNTWGHALLHQSGHTSPSGSTISEASDSTGCFLFRSSSGTGTFNASGVQLRWDYGANGVLDSDSVEVCVFGIEMVYVPQGGFSLGSGGSESGAFYEYPTQTNSYSITSESAITIGTSNGNLYYPNSGGLSGDQSGPLPAAFPKGYQSFYCMKYEISQIQYVGFLNKLTSTQASNRFSGQTTKRHGITGTFGAYSTTSPNVACNFLSWADLTAYLDWAALRPMTELEFEKVCRGTLAAVADEYVWGTTTLTTGSYTLSNAGVNNEGIQSGYNTVIGNALYSSTQGSIDGPVRVGVFAAHDKNSGRVTSGAGYYGVMEMAGNLWEPVISVGHSTGRAFTGNHGNGEVSSTGVANVALWPGTSGAGAGQRGGCWGCGSAHMNTSSRHNAANTDDTGNDTDGGRGVRTSP